VYIRGLQPRRAQTSIVCALWIWTCLGAIAFSAQHAQAEPSLRVRAQVSLDLRVSGKEPGLRVEGTLSDDLGARLAHRLLHVTFRGAGVSSVPQSLRNRNIRTDARGHFSIEAPCVGCNVTAELASDPYYEHATATLVVASERPALELEFLEPSELEISLDRPSIGLVLRASGPAVDAVQIELHNELARSIGQGTTGADGVMRLQVETGQLGPYGLGEIVAQVAANTEHAAARASKAVLRTVQTQTELQAKLDAKARSLKVIVQLHAQAQPVVQRAVGVYVDGDHWATLVTDEHGDALAKLELEEKALAGGIHHVSASFQSDIPGLLSSESPSVPIEIVPPSRPSSAWLLLPVLASVAFVLWSARRKPAHTKRAETAVMALPEVRMGAEARGRAAPQLTISGSVEDVDSAQPLLAAIELSASDQLVNVVQTTSDGRFESGQLTPGEYQARVVAPGYAAIAFAFSVPHRGSFTDMQIVARSLRVLALDTYGSFAARMLTESRVRGRTVRETLTAAVGCGKGSASVSDLARNTEEIAYARPIPYEGDLHDLQRAAANALREAGGHGPAPGDPDLGW
jgi:hypothetical protein